MLNRSASDQVMGVSDDEDLNPVGQHQISSTTLTPMTSDMSISRSLSLASASIQPRQQHQQPIVIPIEPEQPPISVQSSAQVSPIKVDDVLIDLKTEFPTLPLESREYHAILKVKAPSLASSSGKDYILLVDVSGSMAGEPLETLQNMMLSMIEVLQPQDRVSVISFNEEARVIANLTCVTDEGKALLQGKIAALISHGGTNIISALRESLSVVMRRQYREDLPATIILFTDGKDDKVKSLINALIPANYPHPEFTIHTFGIGSEHQAAELNLIAQHGNGSYVSIPNIESIPEIIQTRLGHILTIAVNQLAIRLSLQEPFTNFVMLSQRAQYANGVVTLYGLGGDQERNIVFCFTSPPNMEFSIYPLLRASIEELNYNRQTRHCDFSITCDQGVYSSNPEVMIECYREKVASALFLVAQVLGQRDYAQAKDILTQMHLMLNNAAEEVKLMPLYRDLFSEISLHMSDVAAHNPMLIQQIHSSAESHSVQSPVRASSSYVTPLSASHSRNIATCFSRSQSAPDNSTERTQYAPKR